MSSRVYVYVRESSHMDDKRPTRLVAWVEAMWGLAVVLTTSY